MKTNAISKKKFLFLNTDGTLNTGHWHSMEDPNKWVDGYDFIYYQPAVKNLSKIIEATGAKIILLFRRYSNHYFVEMWKDRKLPGEPIKGIFRSDINGEINLLKQGKTGFAIIDCVDKGISTKYRSHLVMVNPEIGITQSDVEKAIIILNMDGNDDNRIPPAKYPKPFSLRTSVYLEDLFDKLIHGTIKDNHSNCFLSYHLWGPNLEEKTYYRAPKDDNSYEFTKVTLVDKGKCFVTDLSLLHNNDVEIEFALQDEKLIIQSTGLEMFGIKKFYSINLTELSKRHVKTGNGTYCYTDYHTSIVYNKEYGISHELVPFRVYVRMDDLLDEITFYFFHKGVPYHFQLWRNSGLYWRYSQRAKTNTSDEIEENTPF